MAPSESRIEGSRAALARIFVIFLPMAAIGTVGHELGHIVVARSLGHRTILHYGSMSYAAGSLLTPAEEDLVRLGGPASTMLLGVIGLAWLSVLRRKKSPDAPLGVAGWIATLLALHWLREIFNPLGAVLFWVWTSTWASHGDEARLAHSWRVSEWVTSGLPFIVGVVVCSVVAYRLFPAGRRLQLTIALPVGCMTGFGAWYGLLGPWLLP